jgi:hypothetical protein
MTESLTTPAPDSRPCRVEVQEVRRDRIAGAARVVASLAALVAVPWGLGALGQPGFSLLGGLAALVAYFWSATSLAGADRGPGERRFAPGRAVVQGDRLLVTIGDDMTGLPLSRLAGGWVERTGGGDDGEEHAAVLWFSDGRVVAATRPSEQEATAFLAEAGAGVAARAVRMRGYREDAGGRRIAGFFAAFFGLLLLPMVAAVPVLLASAIWTGSGKPLGVLASMLFGLVPLGAIFRWMWRKVRPTWIQIGADGVVVQGAFRKRFIPHADIVRAKPRTDFGVSLDRFVDIELRTGRKVEFPAGSEAEAQAVCDRIHAARTATQEQDRARLLDVLARGGRPVPDWRRALESVLSTTGYRSAGHDVEEVMRIVEDATAPLEQRVAAALAARAHGGETVQKRIRVAAEACVEPRVRVALEHASAGELDDAALAEIDASAARSGD